MTDQIIPIPFYDGNQAVPVQQRNDRADLIDKIKPDPLVETIRHRLMGEEFINGDWKPVLALKNRSLTPIGAWEIANLMLGVSSINVSISNLKDNEIKERALRIARTAQYLCISHWREYGIRNISQLYFVHEIVFTNALVVLKQAGGGSIQELLKGTVHEQRNLQTVQPSGGRIKKILGMG